MSTCFSARQVIPLQQASEASIRIAMLERGVYMQVEQNLHPGLKGRAFAIQQHQDIIAVRLNFDSAASRASSITIVTCSLQVNYAARAAGVKKHSAPKEVCYLSIRMHCLLSYCAGSVHTGLQDANSMK